MTLFWNGPMNRTNRRVLRTVGVALAVVVAAIWAMLTFADGHDAALLPGGKYPSIVANLASASLTIPRDFVGWSIEPQDIGAGGIYTGTSPLIRLARLLGPRGVLRVGGNTQDNPGLALTQKMASDLAAFAAGLGPGWTLIFGLDGVANNSSLAVTQAGYIINAFGIDNVVFQIGNEPNESGQGWTSQSQWTRIWNSYHPALVAMYPSIKFGAPDLYSGTSTETALQSWVGGLTPGISGLTTLSSHFYPLGSGQTVKSVLATVDAHDFKGNAQYAPGKLRMTETNPIYNGGQLGISNTMTMDAWYLNLAITLASEGWQGLENHSVLTVYAPWGRMAYYNPFVKQRDGNYSAAPIFYGMYLFSKIAGQQIVATNIPSGLGATVKAISTKAANGRADILVDNNSSSAPLTFLPDQSASWRTAHVLLLSGASCTDTAPTLGGAVIGENGAWAGAPVSIKRGETVTIPPCGAALIQIVS